MIRVYDSVGNVIETHEHKGDFKEPYRSRFSALGIIDHLRRRFARVVDRAVSSITRWCNNRNVLHLRFAHFQRVLDSANLQNVLAGMNVI